MKRRTITLSLLLIGLAGCRGEGITIPSSLPPVTGGYPTNGQWVLERRPHATIEIYFWGQQTPRTLSVDFEDLPRHPISGDPLLTLPEETVIRTTATFTQEEEHYTQGTLAFDPPVAGQLALMSMQAYRTPEGTEEVRRHGPMANFSRWVGTGPALAFEPTEATDGYTLTTAGGEAGGWFGCSGDEDMRWSLFWEEGQHWVLRKQYTVLLTPGAAETPPGTCTLGLDRLREALRADSLPALDLWRQLSGLGAFSAPGYDDVMDFSAALIAVEYIGP